MLLSGTDVFLERIYPLRRLSTRIVEYVIKTNYMCLWASLRGGDIAPCCGGCDRCRGLAGGSEQLNDVRMLH